MPASSSASVRNPSVSGESSTTSTMSAALLVMHDCLQCGSACVPSFRRSAVRARSDASSIRCREGHAACSACTLAQVDRFDQVVVEKRRDRGFIRLRRICPSVSAESMTMAGRSSRPRCSASATSQPSISGIETSSKTRWLYVARPAQALGSARGGQDRESERLEQLHGSDRAAVGRHRRSGSSAAGRHSRAPATPELRCVRGRGDFREQQLHPKYAALARRAGDRDLTAHGFHQHLGDGQAEPGAGRCARRTAAGALERLEHAIEVLGMDADAGILDRRSSATWLRYLICSVT